jgi:predicted XRE-type DNA-binding protein
MTGDIELVRGSGDIYRDFASPDAGLEQARALVAAAIIRNLDARKLSTRDAEKLTGVSHSEFSRIRNAQLLRFTLDRMIAILDRLDADVEVAARGLKSRTESSRLRRRLRRGRDILSVIRGKQIALCVTERRFMTRKMSRDLCMLDKPASTLTFGGLA